AISRAGVGKIIIVDHARIDETNLNRQLIALESTVGQYKTEAAAARVRDINPGIELTAFNVFSDAESILRIISDDTDYIIDAIDSIGSKLDIIEFASKNNVRIISCMGTGNKLDPSKLKVSDIYKTSVDPLARVIRSELKKRGIKRLKVVWSDETPAITGDELPRNNDGKRVPASISYVPSSAGLLLASEVVRDIIGR
ncbi:MAG: tRNA threonylcarbamoyladenosine dehydratase, partial [Clostridia bacterium]|nr:tRNA threonylcarbamoyladenosine dehydratase [Clostridia bacterium]